MIPYPSIPSPPPSTSPSPPSPRWASSYLSGAPTAASVSQNKEESMNWYLIVEVLPLLFEGALLTVKLTAMSLVLGLFIALPLSLLRASSSLVLSGPVLLYTFVFRGTPLLVQLFLIYYGASQFHWVLSRFVSCFFRALHW